MQFNNKKHNIKNYQVLHNKHYHKKNVYHLTYCIFISLKYKKGKHTAVYSLFHISERYQNPTLLNPIISRTSFKVCAAFSLDFSAPMRATLFR